MALTRFTRLRRVVIGSAVVTGALLVAPLAAQAVPHPQPALTSSKQVSAKLAELAVSSEKLAEQLNQAQIDITAAQANADAATQAAAAAQLHLQVSQRALAVSISSQYKSPSFSHTAALLASTSSDGYLQTVQSMNLLTEHQSEVAIMASSAIKASAAASARASAAVATAEQKRAVLVTRREALDAQVVTYKKLLATLTAAERAKYFTPATPPTAAKVNQVFAAATAVATSKTTTPAQTTVAGGNVGKSVQTPTAPANLGSSQGAARAILAARAELGKPYVWGASGPGSFDCSGLTAWAWRAAGVNLPHNAAAQSRLGTAVAQGDLQPGDLVFFGSPAYHVALYLGDGLIIHAPTSGDVVKIVNLSVMRDYSGARRVG